MIWVYTKIFCLTLQKKTNNMEEIKNKRGGKREGAGRKPLGISTHAMALKLDNDLYEKLGLATENKNRYINDAVRDKLAKDGFI